MNDETMTDLELQARGFSLDHLRREIAAGRLKATAQGTGFYVTDSDFRNWHSGELQRQQSGRSAGTPPTAPRTGGAKVEWNARVAQHMSRGMSRTAAIRRVDRERAGLRARMLQEHNTAVRRQSDLAEARAAVDRAARQRV
jgi:hypothetical protein